MNTDERYYISSNKFSTQERITKRGRVYDIIFRIVTLDGVEKQKKLSGFFTKGAAKEAYLDFVQQHCELTKGKAIRKKKSENATPKDDLKVKTLAALYFESLSNQIKDATIYEKKKLFDLFLIPRFGYMDVRDINKQELYKWQDELWTTKNTKTGDYCSYRYLTKIRTYFSAFLTWCSERYETTNYLLQIKKPKRRTSKKDMQFWTRDEFNRFIAVVDKPVYHTLFMTMFYTGRRKGEILALTPNDVDLSKKSISFTKSLTRKTLTKAPFEITSTKAEKKAATPICDSLLQELEQYTPIGDFYFGGDTPLTDNTIRRTFNAYAAKANVKQIRIHDLRHSFVSLLIHLGAPLTVVADLIGDTLAQVTKTYAHLYDEDKQSIIAKIG
mgnify:CR=1 FL=1